MPLNPGLLLSFENEEPITPQTESIIVRIKAEEGFNPSTEVDVDSLRFGASKQVNFGGGARALGSEADGRDLVVAFGPGHGITREEFAPKLLGRSVSGDLLYGYARQPSVDYVEPILSARSPTFERSGNGPARWSGRIVVENFGPVASQPATLTIEQPSDGSQAVTLATAEVPALEPYAQAEVAFEITPLRPEEEQEFAVKLRSGRKRFPALTIRSKLP
jgi:hypothetical protein